MKSIHIIILLYIAIIDIVKSAVKIGNSRKNTDQYACLYVNSIDRNDFTVQIKDSNTCNSVANNCCYTSIKYNYGNTPIDYSYCSTVTGEISVYQKKLIDAYTDEVKWYANYTYNNYDTYSRIGNNLNHVYYSKYSCFIPTKLEDYSTYLSTICSKFNDDGTCAIINDEEYFEAFTNFLYKNITDSFCNNVNEKGKCIEYNDPTRANNTALNPLMDILIKSLSVDKQTNCANPNADGTCDTNTNENNGDNTSDNEWPKDCIPIPALEIKVVCPPDYVSGRYIKNSLAILIVYIMFLLY